MPSIQPPPAAAREHVVLLGDSIFDNRAYTRGEPDVVTHLRALLPQDWAATLCAVDGARASGLERQLRCVPGNATRLVVAIGGNDALANIDLLSMRVSSSAETLSAFDGRLDAFEREYRRAIRAVVQLQRPLTVCTIYNGALSGDEARLARIALMTFNDVILRTAFRERLDVIDLRMVCDQACDYANPIEPSGEGGRKIAFAIAHALGLLNPGTSSHVWTG